MRVFVDLRSLMGGKISGIENYLLNILRGLSGKLELVGFYNSYSEVVFPVLPEMEIKRSRIPNKILTLALSFLKFPKFEKLYGKMNVVWMPDLRPFALSRRAKLALTVHDLSPIIHPEFYSVKMRVWHFLIRHKQAFKRADLIFAVSEYTKNDLVKICGINSEKIKVVYPGIDHSNFRVDLDQRRKEEVNRKYSLPGKYILSISTVEPRKNILSLIRSFELIKDTEMSLVIAGKLGWVYRRIIKAVGESPKKNKIKLIGYVDEKDKPFLIGNAAIVCYPSFYEGFGFVPLEAMACGVPVITSARTAMPEVCADAAMLVEPYQQTDLVSAIDALLQQNELRRDLITKGLERVKIFTWEKCNEQIQNYLLELAK